MGRCGTRTDCGFIHGDESTRATTLGLPVRLSEFLHMEQAVPPLWHTEQLSLDQHRLSHDGVILAWVERSLIMPAVDAVPTEFVRVTRRAVVPILLVVGIVVLSSLAPFLRFGERGVSISNHDVMDAALFVATWLPFLLVGLIITRLRAARRLIGSPWILFVSVALLPFVPTAHTQFFLFAAERLGGASAAVNPVAFVMLSFLGGLQYLVVVALVTAEASGRVAEQARLTAAHLEVSHAQLRQELAELRMAALHAQLQPHFLFNTLNSISALLTSDPAGARRMLIDLSTLLRSMLENVEQPFVPLEQEIRLVRSYLSIQQVRFGDRLAVHFDLDDALQQQPVPPMLLQPLAENAVQHAMNGNEQVVRVMIRTSRSRDQLVLEIVNSGPSPRVGAAEAGGVGLRNVRERLRQLYGDQFRFELVRNPEGSGAVARVELPLHASPA